MQIKQANTYKYETKHFGAMLKDHKVLAGQCFRNVKTFCKRYKAEGRNVCVALTFGMRGWDGGGATYGYHYVVKDLDTGEYTDPQYSRYTFVELHSWTLAEYEKECKEFRKEYCQHPAQEFAYHYVELYKKPLLAAMKLIKEQGRSGLSDAKLKVAMSAREDSDSVKPKYGKKEIELLNIH